MQDPLLQTSFFYLDSNRHAEERSALANYKGFAVRKALLGLSAVLNTETTLNQYSFFETLEDELLSNTRLEMNITLEDDNVLIWQGADDCRVIVMRMQLIVPQITFNSEGQSLYMSQFLKHHKWPYSISEKTLRGVIVHNKEPVISRYPVGYQNLDMFSFS